MLTFSATSQMSRLHNMSIEKKHGASSQISSSVAVAAGPGAGESASAISPIRAYLNTRGSGRLADSSFAALMLACACSIFIIVLFIFTVLLLNSHLSLTAFGWTFFVREAWDPVAGDFGALPFIYG